ncbi:MAG: LamG-like jellyroll fold domain-containing protein, partial [Isosphaeraceae bacterium]
DATGLVAYLPLTDAVPASPTAPAQATYAPGINTSARSFDGSTDYVYLPPTGLSNFSGGFSVGVWIRPSLLTNNSRIIDFGRGAGQDNILLAINSANGLYMNSWNGTTSSSINVNNVLDANAWQYISMTLDGSGQVRIYKNGTQVASGTVNALRNIERASSFIGRSNWGDPLFTGQMRDMTIWNTAITPAQVKAIMAVTPAAGTTGLVNYYPLSAATSANDSTSAFLFSGPNQYFNAGAGSSLALAGQSSLEAWVYPTGPGNNADSGGVILSKAGEYELVRFADGSIRWQFANASAAFATQARYVLSGEGNVTNLATGQNASWQGNESYAKGRYGQAMVFDGSASISLDGTGLSDFSRGFSASLWVNPSTVSFNETFFQLADAGGTNIIRLWREGSTNNLLFSIFVNNQRYDCKAPLSLEVGKWQHFGVMVQTDGTAILYKNNTPFAYANMVLPANVVYSSASVGYLCNGMIDDVAIYNRAISKDEVQSISVNVNLAAGNWVNSGFVAPENAWSHIVVTYDNGLVRTYGNGSLVSTVTGAGAIGDTNTANNDLTIGGVAGAARSFQGRLDAVKV